MTATANLLSVQDQDPFDYYEQLRAQGPIARDPHLNGWLILDYELCREVESNEDRFSNPYVGASDLMKRIKGGESNITLTHGELHDRLRRFHSKLLSPKAVASYREKHVRPVIEFLIERIRRKGSADLVADFAYQMPPRVIASLFAMPWQDDELVERILLLHEDVMEWIGTKPASGPIADRALQASEELNAMLLPYLRARRIDPQDDFASRIWLDAPEYFGDLDEAAALGISREIFAGGSDTSTHGLANCFYLMLTRPDLRERIGTDRGAVLSAFVEESMRIYGSVQYRFRIAVNDGNLADTAIKSGDLLVLVHAAANRDPKKFACPAHVDLLRPRLKDHLAFNAGPRTCVGAGLARVEMLDSVEAVLDGLPNVQLDPTAEQPKFASWFLRSWRPLHVVFDRP